MVMFACIYDYIPLLYLAILAIFVATCVIIYPYFAKYIIIWPYFPLVGNI